MLDGFGGWRSLASLALSLTPNTCSFHYSKPASESAPQFEADVQTACSAIEYKDFKVTQTEPGSSDLEGFVAFVYK